MDQHKKTKKDRKYPRVPIKTYKWEDIRRSRKRGGYPWTYLYKQPFNEQLDPEPFTMNALRKSKSSSTMERSEGVQISDVTESDGCEGKMDTLQIVTEPDDRSARNSIGSLVIEECDTSDIGEADSPKPENAGLESADSSDNISQYLDKDERGPIKDVEEKKTDVVGENLEDKKEMDSEDLAVEEQYNRKRKKSAESSYSRVSSTKDAIMKKFNDTKNKIKVPKLTFPVNKLKRPAPKATKNVTTEPKKESKKQATQPKDIKPVYIHIPLKPPPGQTDEFSYLEFEEKAKPKPPQTKGVGSFKLLAKNIKRLQETVPSNEQVPSIKENEDITSKDDTSIITNDNKENVTVDLETDTRHTEDNKLQDVKETVDKVEDVKETVGKVESESEEAVSKNDAEVLVEEDVNNQENNTELTEADKTSILKKSTETAKSSSKQKKGILKEKQERAKSEEPERKRKLSLESSYSRKSLSKLEFMKKLRETSQKIKKTFSTKKLKQQPNLDTTVKEKEKRPKKSAKQEKSEPVKPVYIHIPLKPPEGEKIVEDESSQPSNSPESPVTGDVQFIILTAPSDDEVLDYHSSDVPETPSENKTFFDNNKIDELKKLAKDAVNDITPSLTSQKLEPVTEETSNDNKLDKGTRDDTTSATKDEEELPKEVPSDKEKKKETMVSSEIDQTTLKESNHGDDREKMMIDVEDGLSESCIKDNRQQTSAGQKDPNEETEGKSEEVTLNSENTTNIKKKVSFRKRSRTSKDGSYEEIGPQNVSKTSDEQQQKIKETPDTGIIQFTGGDKQMDLDKNASFKEDEDKWSKISDHEYEPVNPPPEVQIVFSSTPTLNVAEETNHLQSGNRYPEVTTSIRNDSPVDNEVSHVTETLSHPQRETTERISTPTQQFDTRQSQDTHTTDKSTDPNKFQLAWRQTTTQFKNKIRGMRKPSHETTEEDKPKPRKFKFEKPKFNLPKIPDTPKINLPSLPSFNLPRRSGAKRSLKQRQQSTESNAGDSKKISFDFSTYPRMFKKKSKPKTEQKQEEFLDLALATSPPLQMTDPYGRSHSGDATRVPLHSDQSVSGENMEKLREPEQNIDNDNESLDDDRMESHIRYKDDFDNDRMESHIRYNDDIDNNRTASQIQRQRYEDDIDNDRMASHIRYNDDIDNNRMASQIQRQRYKDDIDNDRMASHIRYKDDIDIDDEFESQEINNDNYLNRWNRGSFNPELDAHFAKQFENSRYEVTDLDFEDDNEQQALDYNSNHNTHNRERYSSGSSYGGQRVGGVLEEINPDEFFLRQKGISQDNIEVGMYLSSEIKEAFRTPDNALSKLEDPDFNLNDSNQSLPETPNKRKPIKKPKRKKTPHVSQERISHGESEDDDADGTPPSRPKRRSKRKPKPKHFEDVIPYQETIPVETNIPDDFSVEHENKVLDSYDKDRENNNLHESDRFGQFKLTDAENLNFEYIDETQIEKPAAPPRKHKSLKSLTSENDSILEEIRSQIQTPELDNGINRTDPEFIPSTYPLKRPARKKSRTSLQSRTSGQSKEEIPEKEEYLSSSSQLFTSENQIPCVEEPCVKDIRDHMGYAIIDKQKVRDPPLPPPRSPSRKKRSTKQAESDFFTVPRQSRYDDAPVRPLRNYSTLGQTRKVAEPVTYENKENIIQYIEIEDEPNRDLQSGDVIRKMKDRPLPAPPRPPRKSRPLQNITSQENIMTEIRASTDTPISDDEFRECDDEKSVNTNEPADVVHDNEKYTIERRLITPDYFTHQETITHGSLLVQSLNGDKIVRDSEITVRSQERIIPVSAESDDETSSVPDDFKRLKDPPPQETNVSVASPPKTEVEVLKAQRLQVVDLDVDTLTVNKLLAGKIIVSEIDSHGIRTDEIHIKSDDVSSGDIKVNIAERAQKEEPVVILETSQPFKIEKEVEIKQEEICLSDDNLDKEKKTSINVTDSEVSNEPTQIPPDHATYLEKLEDDITKETVHDQTDSFNQENTDYLQSDPPEPPPRSHPYNLEMSLENSSESSRAAPPQQLEKTVYTTSNEVIQEPDVDDEPPPRPPQPHLDYVPSQPPASFYALRAQKYVDSVESNIPKIPRRKRPPKSVSRSSSEDSLVVPVSRRFYSRSPEPSISQLSGQLIRTCGSTAHSALRRLITDITNNVKKNADGKLDLHVMTIILLILIAGLILLGYGEEKTVVHLHHWEYFNPPRDL